MTYTLRHDDNGKPVLQTARLVLRAPREDDFAAMLAFNESSARNVFIGGTVPRGQVWRNHLANIGHWALRGYGFYSVDTKAGDFIGRVGVIFHDGWAEPELAYHLFDGFEGKGYALEAAVAARDDAYARLRLDPLISYIDPANARSVALALRLGASVERQGELLGKPCDIYRHPMPQARA